MFYKVKNIAWRLEEHTNSRVLSETLDFITREFPKFFTCTASSHPGAHHYGDGGLLKHTEEVVELCIDTALKMNIKDNIYELFLAALFHDLGKIFDYELKNDEWKTTDHKYKIHHIFRSATLWEDWYSWNTSDFETLEVDKNRVTHCILSHHGFPNWGSPVQPQTQNAWILHCCDMISARMDDIYTNKKLK